MGADLLPWLVVVLASAAPHPALTVNVSFDDHAECEKLLPLQRSGRSCHVPSHEMAAQLKAAQLLPAGMNVSRRVRHELAAHLVRHQELGMVTCDPPIAGRDHLVNLFPYLRISLPVTAAKQPNVHALCKTDCNPSFFYVAAQVPGPALVRREVWEALGSPESAHQRTAGSAEPGSIPPQADLALRIWSAGWSVAMVSCSHLAEEGADPPPSPFEVMWRPPQDSAAAKRFGSVEALNARLIEHRLAEKFPLRAVSEPRPPPLPVVPPLPDGGLTVVLMTYKNEKNALAAKSRVETLSAIASKTNLLREIVLLWNSVSAAHGEKDGAVPYSPPPDFLAGIDRARLVVAPTNDLQNRMNMDLVQPKTVGIMSMDDDQTVLTLSEIEAAYALWKENGGRRNVGFASRGMPISISTSTIGRQTFCRPVYAYLGHGGCEHEPFTHDMWIVENPFIFHADMARAFTAGHGALHDSCSSILPTQMIWPSGPS